MSSPLPTSLTHLDAVIDRSPLMLTVDMPLKQAIAALYDAGSSCALVVAADQTLVGMITERDVVRLTLENQDLTALTVGEVMGRSVVSLPESAFQDEDSLAAQLAPFQENPLHHLALVDDQGRVTGIISQVSVSCALNCVLTLQRWLTRYQLAEQASGIVIYQYKFDQNRPIWGMNFEEILGYSPENTPQGIEDWISLI